MPWPVLSKLCATDAALGAAEVRELVIRTCPARSYLNKKVLLIVPDATRTAPVDLCFKALHEQLARGTRAFDVMVALGTHQPMTEKAICDRLGISLA
jgi:Lactate racemase N-terminal domain